VRSKLCVRYIKYANTYQQLFGSGLSPDSVGLWIRIQEGKRAPKEVKNNWISRLGETTASSGALNSYIEAQYEIIGFYNKIFIKIFLNFYFLSLKKFLDIIRRTINILKCYLSESLQNEMIIFANFMASLISPDPGEANKCGWFVFWCRIAIRIRIGNP
jgi:hypothetical protein